MNERPRDALGRPLSRDASGSEVVEGVPLTADLSAYEALRQAGAYLLEGKPFHAHEVFEQRWRLAPSQERELWRSLAQWGAALTHELRGNPTGADALLRRAADGLTAMPEQEPPLVEAVPELSIGSFILTAVKESDRDDLHSAYNDSAMKTWILSPGEDPVTVATRQLEQRMLPTHDSITWVIRDAATERLLGRILLFHVSLQHRRGETGYWTAPWARGQGAAPAALRAVSAWAMDTLGLRRIELFHALDNTASCAVARKAGFELEGTLRGSYVYGDGQPHDEHLHGLVRP